PTFRDPGGLWQKFKPEELANVGAFLNNPSLVQGWYAYRRKLVLETEQPEVSATIPFANATPVNRSTIRGGDVRIEYRNGALEVYDA
ncbi:MAG: hypothetical protein R3324_08310, partial [Halobacteriales archaeon]|nr:hypothetical protein [Halobacteriales archaeon]